MAIMAERGTGRTTRLFEEAIRLLAEMPEDSYVIITGPHTRWLYDLERSFKAEGLEGVKFMSVSKIMYGGLHGMKGVLLIDNFHDLTYDQQMYLSNEQQRLKIGLK